MSEVCYVLQTFNSSLIHETERQKTLIGQDHESNCLIYTVYVTPVEMEKRQEAQGRK